MHELRVNRTVVVSSEWRAERDVRSRLFDTDMHTLVNNKINMLLSKNSYVEEKRM